MKTDELGAIGSRFEAYDYQRGIVRVWRIVEHVYYAAVGRVVEMVTLESEHAMDGYVMP